MTSPLSRSDAPTSTAYWTRPQPEQPQPEPCWASRCTNDAATQPSVRWRGRYCQDCLTRLAEDAERNT